MFQLEMLPAFEGDCLILSWGQGDEVHRILVDAGRKRTATHVLDYAKRNKLGPGAFELFVITHIDRDHIEGAVELLKNKAFRPLVKEVWFNGRGDLDFDHVAEGFETFGALDGERIEALLARHGIDTNRSFRPAPVAVEDERLPRISLPGDLHLTILSPDQQLLAALAKPWDETVASAPPGWEQLGEDEPIDIDLLLKRPFRTDRARPNGSSIAMVASHAGKHILLTGDAFVDRLLSSLEMFRKEHPEFAGFDLVKAAHHGSRNNISSDLVAQVRCRHWAISTSGAQFGHPDKEAIARIVAGSPAPATVAFNYDSDESGYWRRPLKGRHEICTMYGDQGYLAIDVAALD